ncbi:MAG: hypothetical protein ABSG81_11240, partial [Acidimicrobiales bacterium]
MARRIDIELTSSRDDGTWTWRAPGARQPRGTLEGALLPDGAKVGDVLRADADFEMEGIVVTAVLAPKAEVRAAAPERIEIIGSGRDNAPGGVSVILAPGGRRREEGGRRRDEGTGRGARPRRDAPGRGAPRSDDDRRPARGGDGRGGDTRDGAAARGPRPERGARPDRGARPERGPRPDGAPRGDRPARPDTAERAGSRAARPERPERPRRLQAVSTNRNAALAELRPEQLPVAEQLLRGGIPAVRHAIEEQNARARSEG